MSSWVGEIHLGPRVVQPQSFLGRGQLVSLEETLEQQVTPLPQVRQATIGHPHPRTLAALAVRPHRQFDSAAVQGHRRTRRLGSILTDSAGMRLCYSSAQMASHYATVTFTAAPGRPRSPLQAWPVPTFTTFGTPETSSPPMRVLTP